MEYTCITLVKLERAMSDHGASSPVLVLVLPSCSFEAGDPTERTSLGRVGIHAVGWGRSISAAGDICPQTSCAGKVSQIGVIS